MSIILYTNHCPCCQVLEFQLKKAGLLYKIIDNTEEMLALGMTHMPMLRVDGNLMNFSAALTWLKERKSTDAN